jgi:hypothetical protein
LLVACCLLLVAAGTPERNSRPEGFAPVPRKIKRVVRRRRNVFDRNPDEAQRPYQGLTIAGTFVAVNSDAR